MEVKRKAANSNDKYLQCGAFKFQHVEEITYLGSQLNQTNSIHSDIQARIGAGNRCYYTFGKVMKTRAINKNLKLQIYKTIIRPVVTYGCETWTLTHQNEQRLRIFERKILRKIFGPVINDDGTWRIRRNDELNELIRSADIVRFIKSKRIAWIGHVMRMEETRMPKRLLEWKPMGRRIRGRPRKRWLEDIEDDIHTMGIRGWRKMSNERTEWKTITEKAKTHSGL
jgi:hypothetical protein